MCGRPPVAGLRAVVVAMMLVALPSGAVLAEQIRPILPGLGAKPKALKRARRPFRPTLPQRNPTRVSADITASIKVDDGTSSPLSASGADASGMAGAASAANVALTGPGIPPQESIDVAAAEPASESETTAALADGADTAPAETASDEQDSASTATEPTVAEPTDAEPAEEPVETAAATSADATETVSDDATDQTPDQPTPETAAAAADETEESATKKPTTEAVDEAPADDSDEQTSALADSSPPDDSAPAKAEAESGDAEMPAPAAEADAPVEPPPTATESSPPKEAARLEPEPSEAEPKETARLEPEPEEAEPEEAETKQADTKDAESDAEPVEAEQTAAPEPEVVEAKPVATIAPSYDATVVIDVLPPPDKPAAASEPDAQAKDDDAPMELAAVTPPSEPEPGPAIPAVADTPAAADADDAPADAAADSDKADTAESAGTPPAETPIEAAPNDDSGTPATATEDAAEPEGAVVTVAPPPPPPAHPVVAAIREKLADPAFRKGFNASTLKGLEEFYGAREGPPLWIADGGFKPKAQALIAEIGKADDWGLDARDFDAPKADAHPSTEDEQAAAELELAMAVLKYARYAQGGARSPSSYSPLFDQRPELSGPHTILTGIAEASEPAAYLTSLHPQHAQFKALRAALVKARARAASNGRQPRNDSEVQLLTINMERWRWLPRNLGNYYVWNNVPEFNVRVMKGGKSIYQEKTVVGQLKYATPFFSAPMRNIVFHPNWTVPPTIVNEDLAPKLQSQRGLFSPSKTDMLRGYGLSVSYKGKPIDADEVDWQNVNIHEYTFTQDPGPSNVLGKFKFNFPNRHAIYMHDTVQPELFAERVRTLSHGCIRVHEPDRFAALLLAQDKGWSYAQIQRLVAKDESTVIGLNHKVPVHLTYFTATIDENGGLNRFGDIYGIDSRMAAKMFDNPARFPVPATPAIAEQPRSGERGRSARRGGGGLDDLISGLFGN